MLSEAEENYYNECIETITTFNNALWERKVPPKKLDSWLSNFADMTLADIDVQKLHVLYLLTQFMYFGSREIKEMLSYIYLHLFKYPTIRALRKENGNTLDRDFLESAFQKELACTRFLAIGNPSESGTHLLYYFRQQNHIPKDLFINTHEIFSTERINDVLQRKVNDAAKRYIFIDDFCGSGSQAEKYSKQILDELKQKNPDCQICYFVLFSTTEGKQFVLDNTLFDKVECVFELDNTFRCFSDKSRFFLKHNNLIKKAFLKNLVSFYGDRFKYGPWGFNNDEQLLAFSHNTPDNTISIFGAPLKDTSFIWNPVFPRYDKNYGVLQ